MVPSLIMLHVYDKIPPESIVLVRSKLKKLDKLGLAKVVVGLPAIKLHDVGMVFWVGSVILGMFGVGRFMIGDKLIGALKITLLFLSYVFIALGSLLNVFPNINPLIGSMCMIAGFVGLLIVVVWWGLDMFLITSKTRRANLNKLLALFHM
ncbi:hypothetical protein CQA53_02170 [Helicobacter didelphidarum]|uniref:TM2 domain-containing protein n=1 Tax=Helicobacter didelphidarum TaxID=2040648 RepID=A0A3D8IR53_9HELI|nr:hypothetical protein [Helicobacter didelphidarum]RDU67084.1 hypothetical protein CQA53_02170 [Helicobacter didelphidarum]